MKFAARTNAFLMTILISSACLQSASAFLLWKAERNDTVIHVLAKADFLSPKADELIAPIITEVFDTSDVIVFEFQLDPQQRVNDQRRIVQSALYPEGDNLVKHLPLDTVTRFNALCEQQQINNAGIVRVKPWAAGYKLNQIATKNAGVDDLGFLDDYFFKRAAAGGKAADYLNKPDELMALYNGLDENTDSDLFSKYLNEAAGKNESLTKNAEAWKSGDADTAAAIVEETFKPYPSLHQAVTEKFSARWTAKLDAMTKYDDSIFVIIPLENAVGPASLLEMLGAEGFTVTQVTE